MIIFEEFFLFITKVYKNFVIYKLSYLKKYI